MKNIEISPMDNSLIYKKEYTANIIRDIIKNNNLNGLRVFAVLKTERIESFDFLKEFTFLEGLEICSRDDYEYDFLKYLTNLKHLKLQNEGVTKIDFSQQTKLEDLSLRWRNNIYGIESCSNLVNLCLVDFKEDNLNKIKCLSNLRELEFATSTIKTLEGVSALALLEHISLGNCRSLTSIKEISGLKKIKAIEISTCAKIQDYNSLVDLPNLETLKLIDCKDIQSLKFIRNFPKLKKLVMLGNTNVLDSDLIPIKDIEEVIYAHRKHYNLKIENKEFDELVKRNMKKVKEWVFGSNTLSKKDGVSLRK